MKKPNRIAFLSQGILRACYYSNKGKEITKYFNDKDNFAVVLNCLNIQIPSSKYVQAVTDCSLLTFSRDALIELSVAIYSWDKMVKKIISKGMS